MAIFDEKAQSCEFGGEKMDAELESELKKCLEKYWRAMNLPPEKRAPFVAGISKLEQRIEELRAATGLDSDQYVCRVQESIRRLNDDIYAVDELDDAVFGRINSYLARASALFRAGEQKGTLFALKGLDSYVQGIAKTLKQEEFPFE
jgi:hypothetical protein